MDKGPDRARAFRAEVNRCVDSLPNPDRTIVRWLRSQLIAGNEIRVIELSTHLQLTDRQTMIATAQALDLFRQRCQEKQVVLDWAREQRVSLISPASVLWLMGRDE